MRVFFDTNIIIELLENRAQADFVDKVLCMCEQNKWCKYISVGSFYTITYLTERMLHRQNIHQPLLAERQREILSDILAAFCVAPTNSETLQAGVDDKAFCDLEDSYQHKTAIAAGCDVLLTINKKDFPDNTSLKVLSPEEFLDFNVSA